VSQLVAVTGAEGFIGSHLVEALVARGHKVRAMVLYNSFNNWGWLETLDADVMANVEVVLGDVRDAGSTLSFCRDAEVVYHLAALIAIPYSYAAPRSYLDTNAAGTLNVLEAARTLGTGRVVHTSTSEVYGTARTVPITEEHPLQGQSPYSASKIAADKLAESYFLSFETPVVTMRPFNTFGPRQSARAVIPTVVSQIAAGATEIKLGDLTPTRDFTYAADSAQAFIAVGTSSPEKVVGQVFNGGTGRDISVGDLVTLIGSIMGREVRPVLDEQRIRPAGSEVRRLLADPGKLQSLAGWKAEVSLEEGLERTAAWFQDPANLAHYKTDRYNV
jgi:NAD dependent epimerase/dehydratase